MGNSYTIHEIATITGGSLYPCATGTERVNEFLIDSRRLAQPEHTLFIALVTGRNDGHKYIDDLYHAGVRCFLISDPGTINTTSSFILVPDTLVALQQLAAYHRKRFRIPVIGITGSNGKTIVKEWLYQLMNPDRSIIRSPKSYNSQIGVPLSVLGMDETHQLAIFEAGISQPGEMENLEKIIRPTIGILTNIGAAHDENFRDRKEKTSEKLKLFLHSETLICSGDDNVINILTQKIPHTSKLSWSHHSNGSLVIRDVEKNGGKTKITGDYKGTPLTILIPFTDEASVENAVNCWLLMLHLGYDPSVIVERILNLTPVEMRLELKAGINRCSLINDSYSLDLNSLGIALDFMNQQKQHDRKTVILSDILQSGQEANALYEQVNQLLLRKNVNRIIGIGKEIRHQSGQFSMEKVFFDSTEDFLLRFPLSYFRDETILLKGARIFEFEKIGAVLQQKVHETVLEINLDAMVHNLNYFRLKLNPGTKMMVMVKAFSYGSGSFEIANLLQFHQTDYLAVAYADEGVELRKAGITLPIMVMNPEEQSFELLLKYRLEPEIYNIRVLKLLREAINRDPGFAGEVPIHIKIDSGMHRLGVEKEDITELLKEIRRTHGIVVRSLFTHLAASEDPEKDTFTQKQISYFKNISDEIIRSLDYPVLRHALNSAGISRFPDAQMEMVRLGIGLYGIGCDRDEQSKLRNVSTLKSSVSQIRKVQTGDTIGYGRAGITHNESIIATIPVGYADGFSRRLGNGRGRVLIHGKPAPVIGNVCMDLTMADVTAIDQVEEVREGDEVIIFGSDYPLTQMAADMDTIPYEVLTGISQRVKRVYYHE